MNERSTSWPANDGQMAARIRAFDWARTPLGVPETWPHVLQMAVDLMLGMKQPACIFWGKEARMLYNDAYLPILGARHPGALSLPFVDVCSDIAATFLPPLEAALQGEARSSTDVSIRHDGRNGEAGERWFTASWTPLRNEAGDVAGVFCSAIETTAHVQTMTALRASEERFRLTIGNVRDYAILVTDPDDRITEWFPGAEAVFGWQEDEIKGKPGSILFTPEDRSAGVPEHEIETARISGQAPNNRWHLRKDGFRRYIEGFVTALKDDDGQLIGFVKIGQDVTQRRMAEEALRQSEERFQQFVAASSDVVWIRNAETLQMEYVSPAFEQIYGTRFGDIMEGDNYRNWSELIVPEDRLRALSAIEKVRTGEGVIFEYRIRRPDGEVRWLRNTDFPLRDESGQVQRIGGIGHDITQEKELSERLQVLVAELQHRTKNLIGVVRSVAQRTAASSSSLEEFQRRFIDRLMALSRINEMLSRLHEGDRITFDEVLHAEISAIGANDGADAQVHMSGPRGVRLKSSTVQTLALALHELATNAMKYGALSRPEGRLEISWDLVRQDGEATRLRVEWIESGVPLPSAAEGGPLRIGSGRELIERALPYQLKADVTYELTPQGVRCEMELPLSRTEA